MILAHAKRVGLEVAGNVHCILNPLSVMAGLGPAIHETQRMRGGWVYIITNRRNGILYTGVARDLPRRVWQHREGLGGSFTRRYGLRRLVWCEYHDTILGAIQREKNLKHWPRAWKVRLIHATNPEWNDLYETINQ
jgi:putative endonuclease